MVAESEHEGMEYTEVVNDTANDFVVSSTSNQECEMDMEEIDSGDIEDITKILNTPRKTQVYKKCEVCGRNSNSKSMAAHMRTQHKPQNSTDNQDSSNKKRQRVEGSEETTIQPEKKKRKCGLCHTPGHYRTKCPNK